MSSSFSIDWASFTETAAKANALNKAIVFEALSKAGITHVCVDFDGEGDQGQMGEPSAQTDGKVVELPSVSLTLHLARFGAPEPNVSETSLRDAVERLCYDYLEQEHGGWENNEGAFGEFTFDVAAQTIALNFYGRIIETFHSSHTF